MATNYERAFEQRPEVYAAWQQLNGAIKAGMDLRRYELATLAEGQVPLFTGAVTSSPALWWQGWQPGL